MSRPSNPSFHPGQVLRTRELYAWSANPTRLAQRLVQEGRLQKLAHGLFLAPKRGRFGEVPPDLDSLLYAFLDGGPFVVTGPPLWNALGLGATALWSQPLVYNTKRSGTFKLGGITVMMRRVAFPEKPTAEWFVVDLLECLDSAGLSREEVLPRLLAAIQRGRFVCKRLRLMASEFGTASTRAFLESVLEEAH